MKIIIQGFFIRLYIKWILFKKKIKNRFKYGKIIVSERGKRLFDYCIKVLRENYEPISYADELDEQALLTIMEEGNLASRQLAALAYISTIAIL